MCLYVCPIRLCTVDGVVGTVELLLWGRMCVCLSCVRLCVHMCACVYSLLENLLFPHHFLKPKRQLIKQYMELWIVVLIFSFFGVNISTMVDFKLLRCH